jgi:two-component system chemotaxis response regulator CheY
MNTDINYETKVLVLDYYSSIRFIVCNLLKGLGFKHVAEVHDVTLAMNVLQKENIGLFIADWDLPNISGLEMVRRIRREARSGDMLVLLATAEGFKADIIEAMHAGADDCLFKPFSADNLKNKIERIFRKRSLEPMLQAG